MTPALNWQVAAGRAEEMRAFERATGERPPRQRFRRSRHSAERTSRTEARGSH